MTDSYSRREVLRFAAAAAAGTGLLGRFGGGTALAAPASGVGLATATGVAAQSAGEFAPAASWVVKPFALNQVSLGDSLFKANRDRILNYARNYSTDRMLATIRINAGLDTLGATPPGGWDTTTSDLRGHFMGHFMTTLGQAYASTGEAVFKDRLDYMVTELGKCQAALDARSARTRAPGKFGSCLRLRGAVYPRPQGTVHNTIWPSEYVSLPTGIVSGLNDFTVAAWVNPASLNDGARIFDFGSGTNTCMYLATVVPGSRIPSTVSGPHRTLAALKFAITTGGAAGEQPVIGVADLPLDQWTHVAVTLSGSNARLYVNGAQVGENPSISLRPTSLGATTQNWIGRSQNSTTAEPPLATSDAFFNGRIDEFQIYSRALSAAEVTALTTSPGGGSGGNVAWYRFDEDYGATALDSSGSGRHATIKASPSHPGYLAAYPETQYVRIEAFDTGGVWAPWYTMHKVMQGPLEAYRLTGNEQALEIVSKLGDWVGSRLGHLPRAQLDQMWSYFIAGEYGGMNEVLVELHALTGKEEYLATAKCFDNTALKAACVRDEDIITRRHGNQHVPQFTGYLRIFDQTGEDDYHTAARNFWGMVVPHRTYSHGGNSGTWPAYGGNTANTNPELFQPRDNIANSIAGNGAETCTTHNMLRLTRNLFFHDPDLKYKDYYGRGLNIQILGSRQHADSTSDPLVTYFVPMGPGTVRSYSNMGNCCGGTGPENHTKYQESVYFSSADESALYVNLYMASTLNWAEKGFVVTQTTNFPTEGTARLTVDGSGPLDVKLRVPYWVRKGFTVIVNGVEQELAATAGSYVTLSRVWSPGDTIDIVMPFSLRIEKALDDPTVQSLFYGPMLLVALSSQTTYLNFTLDEELEKSVTPAAEPMHFTTNGVTLAPFYLGNTNRYHAYFKRV